MTHDRCNSRGCNGHVAIFRHNWTYLIPNIAAATEMAVWSILLDRYGGSIEWLRRQGFDVVEDSEALCLAPRFPW